MIVISTFEHSIEVEEALAVLEKMDIGRELIMTVMMDTQEKYFFKTAARNPAKQTSAFEFGMAGATALSIFGISYGFLLVWGPIIWGIIAAAIGFSGGYGGARIIQSQHFRPVARKKARLPELMIIIRCSEINFYEVRRVLWQYHALSIGRIDI